jgi:hypothetical protein
MDDLLSITQERDIIEFDVAQELLIAGSDVRGLEVLHRPSRTSSQAGQSTEQAYTQVFCQALLYPIALVPHT